MKKMWKRFVSLLLACTLLAGMLPLSASAAVSAPTETEWIRNIIGDLKEDNYNLQTKTQLSGSDVWMYIYAQSYWDETSEQFVNDTVFIFQPGQNAVSKEIPNYDNASDGQPWSTGKPSAIYIADGVTGIGNHAFDGMTTLETFEIQTPGSLTRIGERAFNGCDKLVGPLDLSGVTDMGKYAFNGCERLGSGEDNEGVTLSDELTTIPENAFSSCGLKNVNIPTRCTEIGNNAFANNSLSQIAELVLPEGLTTIGDNAFSLTMGEGNTSSGITSLTIPSSVESIGANAFSGRRNLQTVTVEDDGEEKTELTLGDGAFGRNEFTAYSKQGFITDTAGITYHGLLGTTFYLPADLVDTFKNGENCFTGDISPMEYVDTVEPTCTTDGYHIYKTTISGAMTDDGKPVEVTYHDPLPMLGHDYHFSKHFSATCETNSYNLFVCSRDNSHTENRNIGEESGPIGHSYQLTGVENLDMGDSSATTFTWECQTQEHDDDRDTRKEKVEISINPTAVQADTTMTYDELVMPTVVGGTLTLAENVDEDAPLTTDVTSVKVVFTPDSMTYAGYTGMGAVSGFGGVELTLKVDVNKAELDFSDVNFGNTRVFVNSTASEGTPITVYRNSLPEDVKVETIVYSNETGYDKTTPPPRNSTWSGTVSVTFTYDPDKYEVDTEKKPGADYTFDTSEKGQVTITHPYVIVEQSMNDLAAAPIRSLTYKANTPQDTVHLSGVPYSSTVSWEWEEVGNPSNRGEGTATSSGDENTMDTVPFIEAGTYTVTITVEKEGFTSRILDPITVTIAKATVATPTAVPDLQYTDVEQRGLQEPGQDALYKYVEGSQLTGTNAGPYTAKAQLNDSENYRWSTGDSDGDGTVEISWNIAKRRVIETRINNAYKDQTTPFTGNLITAVSPPSSTSSGFFDVTYDDEGNLVGKIKNTDKVAFKISHAKETNAETYSVIASIEDFDNFCWQNHPENKDVSLGTWTIGKLQINAPTITAPDATYDGVPYDGEVTLKHSKESSGIGSSNGIIDLNATKSNICYYTQPTGGNGGDAPVNVGTYYAGVENWVFEKDKIPGNYTILGGQRDAFTISKAPLTLTAPIENLSVTYTGSDLTVPAPKVDGLKGSDTTSDYSLVYTYTIGESEVTQSQTEELKLSQVGTYHISVSVSQECTNYTSNTVEYVFTISTANQTVKLTGEGLQGNGSAEDPYTISKTLGDDPFTVTGKGYVGENETNAKIAYAVTQSNASDQSGEAVVKVDANSGQVTLLRAGSATITVTAAGSANYQEATASYTITVGKGTPQVAVLMPEGGEDYTYSYTGKELSFDATVTGAPDAVEPVKEEKVSFKFYQDNSGSKDAEISGGQPTEIGTYWVEAVYEGDGNYNGRTSAPVKFTISPAALEVEATGYTGTYDGDEHDPVASIQVTGVGEKTFAEGNYTVSYIKKGSDEKEKPGVNDPKWAPDLKVKDVAHSGDYWIKVVINGDDSSYDPYIGSVKVTIDPKQLTVTKTVKPTKEYDGTTDAKQNVKFTHIDTDIEGETVTAMVTQAEYNSPNVSDAEYITITYHLTAVEYTTKLENYTLEEGGDPISGDSTTEIEDGDDVAITPKPIDVAITNKEKVYDGKAAAVTSEKGTDWTVNETDLCELTPGTKDNLGIALSIASGSKDAGTYAITGTANNSNYDVTFTGSWTGGTAGTYTITHRPISVQIGNAKGFYGDAPVLKGVELTYEGTDEENHRGLAPGENSVPNITLGTGASAQSPVAGYVIYAVDGNNDRIQKDTPVVIGNYNVTFTNEGTYTVKQRPITITIKDHSSKYGAEINGGIADPVSGTDYTVAITNQATTGDAIVKGDNLEIKLTTEATKNSPVKDYDITGSVTGDKVKNYAITWAGSGGNRDGGGKNGRYTIEEAGLAISFEKGNQVPNGVSINITDSYNANPLVLENASTSVAVSKADKATLDITYSIAEAGENGGSTDVATINETTGEVTILKTGTVRITATVTPQGNSNYTGQVTTWYELNIISGGQMALKVTPKTNLAYTGDPQALLESASCSLEGATIKYSLDNQKWEETIPTGTNAGTYTVYVKATDPNSQYSDVTEHVMVTIAKANLEGSFAHDPYPHVLATGGNSYDSAQVNPLDLSANPNYTGKADAYTYRSNDTGVAIAVNGGSTIRVLGSAGDTADITVTVPGDNNYNEGTFTYTLEISDNLSKIVYSVENKEVTYNGQPQTIAVNVTEPDSGATVRYWNEETKAYDLSEPPAYTNVQEGGYPIKFQITAPGYETVIDEATLTINPKPIKENMIAGIAGSYTYTGKEITFDDAISLHDEGVLLKQDTDYTIDYGDNKEVGTGFVTITGMGNYTGKVIEHFDIIPVDGSSGITASIAPNFGTYDPDAPVTAEVTVTHQTGSDSHKVDLTAANAKYTISATDLVTGQAITDHGATGTGDTLTFTKPAIYDITLTLTGDHRGEFHLSYTLLPLSNEDGGLTLTVDDETQKVFTYGDEIDPSDATIKVTANNTDVTDQCTLTYVYTPFEGTPTTTASPYTAEVLENAGVYTVTATPKDGSAITGTGTFTFLILQRDLVEADLRVEDGSLVYNQTAQEPDVTVAVTGNPTADDYTVTYYNNVNASKEAKAVVTATGNNFTGSKTADFTIAPKPITAEMVDDIPDQYYTGNEVIPPVTIKDSSYTLILGYDYTTACEDKGPGAATVTITGTGNYTGKVEKTFTITSGGAPAPANQFDLTVTPNQWTWGSVPDGLALSVTFGTGNELALGTDYTLTVDGETASGEEVSETFDGTGAETPLNFIKSLKPGTYTITATGVGAYNGSTDTETVTIQKIQPEVTVTATPNSLSGGGKVTLTLKGENLPVFADEENLSNLLTATAKDAKNNPDLSKLEWETDEQTGVMTAELTLPNTSETYTFTLTFIETATHAGATDSEQVVVAQQIISGGGGGPVEDQPADPDDTGVSDWLNTKDHLAYLAGYPGGTFGPDQNMTRAEAAQMFYNLLLEKDVEITVEFEDVPADAWYAKPVNTLASLGILSGVGNGRFDPERSITRAEFTVIAMKFANTSGGGVNIFSDVNEDDWFYSAVVDSTQYGWINGYPDGTFRPEATISRAEVTVIVNHMLGRAADRPYVIAHEEELNTFGDVNRGHWGYFHVAEATNAHEYHTEDGTESWTGLS